MYRVNEVFKSLQGEGVRTGTVNVFVRFSGCNMACRIEPGERSPGGFDCDTEFASGRNLTVVELIEWIRQVAVDCRWVIATGGEPGLQLDSDLIDLLHGYGFKIAVETNGSIDLSGLNLDWICVSPKVAEHAVRQKWADEIKYVRNYGQAIPVPSCKSENKLIAPAYGNNGVNKMDLDWCMELVMANPDWRLSIQTHKILRIR